MAAASVTAASSRSDGRATKATDRPSPQRSSARRRPIPRDAPVTMATRVGRFLLGMLASPLVSTADIPRPGRRRHYGSGAAVAASPALANDVRASEFRAGVVAFSAWSHVALRSYRQPYDPAIAPTTVGG